MPTEQDGTFIQSQLNNTEPAFNPVSISGIGSAIEQIGNAADREQKHRNNIALIITWTFSLSVGLLIVCTYLILIIRSPADAKLLFDAAAPTLEKAGTFLSTVFGPLLGFVLGYYFRDRKDRD